VMELVEGPTLADRIAHGPVPLEEALAIARQIAEALEYAHERGIIHRDLKPANIKLTPDGKVKLLDFGLAKALEDSPAAGDISNSPTISAAATRAGVILGTAAYMSPEQAQGKPADRRSDVWSFGVLLYEMLSGKMLYRGDTAQQTLALVMTQEPKWEALPSGTPLPIRRLLERCLTKDPKRRLRDIGEARIAIEDFQAHPADDAPSAAVAGASGAGAQTLWRRTLPWTGVVLFAVTTLLSFWRPWQPPPAPVRAIRLTAELGAGASLDARFSASAVLSPDGTQIAFVGQDAGKKSRLYVRSLDQSRASPLSGTEGARLPFFSPDGQWVAFFADGKLKKVSVQGGAAVTLCDANDGRGGSWGENGTIVFAADIRTPLSKVLSSGGVPEAVTTLDKQAGEVTHRWPQVLPGGTAVLFTAAVHGGNYEDAQAVIQDLTTGNRKTIYRGGYYARYVPTGQLVFIRESTLHAAPFDLKRWEVTGQPVPVLDDVANDSISGGAQFSFSQLGTFLYLSGRGVSQNLSVYWMGRDGKFQPLREIPAEYYDPALSPDGKLLALEIREGQKSNIWLYDWQRDTLTRLTFGAEVNQSPVWTPDGKRITFSAFDRKTGQTPNVYWKRADGAGEAERLTESSGAQYPSAWSPDGKTLALNVNEVRSATAWDIYTLSMEPDGKGGQKPSEPKPFLNTPFIESDAAFSPDGRWIAYVSSESGNLEVYVRPFPGPGGKWQISSGSGFFPLWSRKAKELFYRTFDERIMVISYSVSGETFRAEKPVLWSEGQFTTRGNDRNFDLHPDGKRFVVLKSPQGLDQPRNDKITIVFNFFDELKRKLPPR